MTQAEIQAKIAAVTVQLENLISGQAVAEVTFGDRTVVYAKADIAQLRAYLDSLYAMLDPPPDGGSSGPRRAPIGFWF